MPSRHNRNARKNRDYKDSTHIYQQPTPSSLPSPDSYTVDLPEESITETRGRPPGLMPMPTSNSLQGGAEQQGRGALPTPPLPEATLSLNGAEISAGFAEDELESEEVSGSVEAMVNESEPSAALWDLDSLDRQSNHPDTVASPALVRSPSPSPAPSLPPMSPKPPKTPVRSAHHTPTSSQTLNIPMIPAASAAGLPSPPMVSRPVSFGRFTGFAGAGEPASDDLVDLSGPHHNPTGTSIDATVRPVVKARRAPGAAFFQNDSSDEHRRPVSPRTTRIDNMDSAEVAARSRRRMSYGQGYPYQDEHQPRGYRERPKSGVDHHAHTRSRSGISQAMGTGSSGRARDEDDTVLWAKWDTGVQGRRLLFLAYYPFGLQIWDCTELDSVTEILNLPSISSLSPSTSELDFVYAGVISPTESVDSQGQGPLIGILVSPKAETGGRTSPRTGRTIRNGKPTSSPSSQLLIYSLSKHALVRQVAIPGLSSGGGKFESGDGFVVVSTTLPPALHVLDSITFEPIHKIPTSTLVPFLHPSPLPGSGSGQEAPLPSSAPRRHSFLATTTSNLMNAYNENFGGSIHNYNNHSNNNYNDNRVLLTSLDDTDLPPAPEFHLPPPQPAPVFAISKRLVAFTSSPIPGDVSPHGLPGHSSSLGLLSSGASNARSASIAALASFSEQISHFNRAGGNGGGGVTQADLSNAAMKVGGGILSGMKSLGGMALTAASAAASSSGSGAGAGAGLSRRSSTGGSGIGAFANRFFSKSAPAATVTGRSGDDERRYGGGDGEGISGDDDGEGGDYGRGKASTPVGGESGWCITVMDLAPLVSPDSSFKTPITVTRFIASKSQPVSDIWFSEDGTAVLVSPRDGQVVKVYRIRSNPVARILQETEEELSAGAEDVTSEKASGSPKRANFAVPDAPPAHIYDLRRGRTPAVVESASWSSDGRWVAFGTRKRTVHVFAVNPCGGRSDVKSHMDGVVKNYSELPPLSTDLHPLVRLRVFKHPGPANLKVPLAFTFLDSSRVAELTMPPNLLPSMASPTLLPTHSGSNGHSYGSSNSVLSSSPSTRSEPMSPRVQSPSSRPKNYQDVLMFDPTDGVLSLRRIFVSAKSKARDGGTSILGASISGATTGAMSISRSLPGMGAVGKLAMSVSPNSSGMTVTKTPSSGLSQMMEVGPSELVAKDSTVATWNLRRRKDWGEIKKTLEHPAPKSGESVHEHGGDVSKKGRTKQEKTGKADWLAQAELSTFSKSSLVLPRSIYLTHQFSFHALGEDYHALIRRHQFDIPGPKIEVRKGVEISAYPTGTGESFVEGHRDRRTSSSFDEPLASALTDLDFAPPQAVIPMLPNGTPGSSRSFRNSIPIRAVSGLSDMSEGLGRLRREINKVRSPRMLPNSDNSASVPLEFDEEDEDFMLKDTDISSQTALETQKDVSNTQSTPPTGAMPLDEEDAWIGEGNAAVDEAETFDHISAVGFLDEEQAPRVEGSKTTGRKGRKKHH